MKETPKNLKKLSRFGISEGISELLLTTKNSPKDKKKANAAPIGITWKNDKMFLHLFKGSKTYENLTQKNYFAANMTDDAVLYATSAFYDLKNDDFRFIKITRKNKTISIPILKNANAATVFKCVKRLDAADSMIVHIKPVKFIPLKKNDTGILINRGFHSVIEVCVHLTRYELARDPMYIDEIRRRQTLIQRCGRKNDKKAFIILKKRLLEIEAENKKNEPLRPDGQTQESALSFFP